MMPMQKNTGVSPITPAGDDRIHFLDILAGAAIIRVVCVHALAVYSVMVLRHPAKFLLLPDWGRILDILLRFNVPIFVLLSGFKYKLSEVKHPDRSLPKYLFKRSLRLMIPFLLWSVIYYILRRWLLEGKNPFEIPGFSTTLAILTGAEHPAYQLWFVPMLFFVNIFYPLIKKIIPCYLFSIPLFFAIYFYSSTHHLKMPLNYIEYFIFYDLGALLCVLYRSPRHRSRFKYAAIGFTAAVCILGFWKFAAAGRHIPVWRLNLYLEPAIALSAFFLFSLIPAKRTMKPLASAGRYAWHIYILHAPIVLNRIGYLIYRKLEIASPFLIPVHVAATLAALVVVILLIKKSRLERLLF